MTLKFVKISVTHIKVVNYRNSVSFFVEFYGHHLSTYLSTKSAQNVPCPVVNWKLVNYQDFFCYKGFFLFK